MGERYAYLSSKRLCQMNFNDTTFINTTYLLHYHHAMLIILQWLFADAAKELKQYLKP